MNDLVIHDATVWAGARPKPRRGWIAVRDGKFSAVGDDEPPPAARVVIDGSGKTVLPSFVDCHAHLSAGAIAGICRNGSGFRSKEEVLRAVEVAADQGGAGWLVFFYVDWNGWPVPTPPTAAELEAASRRRNVLIVCETLHRGILSESALAVLNVSKHRDSAFVETRGGALTGIVWESVFSACLQQVVAALIASLGEDRLIDVLRAEANRYLAYGITDVHDPGVTAGLWKHMAALNAASPLRISWSQVGAEGAISSAGDGPPPADFGGGPASAKVFTDGAHRCAVCVDAPQAARMALGAVVDSVKRLRPYPLRQLLQEKFSYAEGRFCREGALFDPPRLTEKLSGLAASHARIKIHALGNQAVEMACACVVEAGLTTRVCIEHATILDDATIESLARHRLQVSVQPGFLPHYGAQFSSMRLAGRYRGLPLRSMLDAGVELNMSSDYPCGPLNPLHNLRCAVERKMKDGRVYLGREAVTQEEAVYAYTVAGTRGITGAAKAGIEPGAPADFVVLSGDPFAPATRVERTWVDGVSVYQNKA